MQPPPGSETGIEGDPAAVGVGVAPWRSVVLWIGTVLMVVCSALVVSLLVVAASLLEPGASPPAPLPLLALLGLWVVLILAMTLLVGRMAVIHRGPMLLVDDEGVRTRDAVGWLRVPWEGVEAIEWESKKGRIVVTAPGRVCLNHRTLRRRALQIGTQPLLVRPDHLLTYLRHRWATASGQHRPHPAGSR